MSQTRIDNESPWLCLTNRAAIGTRPANGDLYRNAHVLSPPVGFFNYWKIYMFQIIN